MADRRLLDYHISRLTNKSAEVRLKSVAELRLLDDPDGWSAIAEAYANETDPEVRLGERSALADYVISQLQVSHSPATRLTLIAQLQTLSAPQALPVLEQIYHADTDATVRQAARDAGFAIFTQQKANGSRA